MCRGNQKAARDLQQVKTLMYRYIIQIKQQKGLLWHIMYPTLVVFGCYLLAAWGIYDPQDLYMVATEQYHVTSTDTAQPMYFYDEGSEMYGNYLLKNCTLRERDIIGLVKQDSKGSTDGFEILQAIFEDLSGRYNDASKDLGVPEMKAKTFDKESDLDGYVGEFNYMKEAFCFAIQWQEFNPETNTFKFDMRMNHGETLANRYPQTHYEEAIANQLYLEEYAYTGMLQIMTSVTKKVLTEQYKIPEANFKIDMMYMPMNTVAFQNNLFSEVVTALGSFAMLAIANLGPRVLDSLADPDESRIQDMLRRAGMRKSVEATFEFMITMSLLPTLLPVMTIITQQFVLMSSSWFFIFWTFIIFTLRVVVQSWVIRFSIDNHEHAEIVEITLEVLQIVLTIFAQILVKINPTFILTASFFLPLLYVSQTLRLGVIAKNSNIDVQLFQSNLIVNDNDLQKIMWISLGALGIKILVLIWTLPFKIFNDPYKLWGPTYLCRPSFWRWTCGREREGDDAHGESDWRKAVFFWKQNDNEMAESLLEQNHTSQVTDETTEALTDRTGGVELHEDEKKLIAEGHWEQPKKLGEKEQYLRLDRINVEHGGHHLVHDLTLTAFPGETICLIGENGSGKSAIIQTIAGLQHVHSGKATVYGMDLFKSYRFFQDNFMTYTCTDPVLVDAVTPRHHILSFHNFLGLAVDEKTIDRTLSYYKLLDVGNIACIKLNRQQQKMLSFAISMIGNTRLILLDNPTEGMDSQSKRLVWETIARRKQNRIIVIATQDMKEARVLGDRIGMVNHGKIGLLGSPKFFAQKFNHSLQIDFYMKKDNLAQNVQQLKDIIKSATKPGHNLDDIEVSEDRLVLKLPLGISYQTIHECIDMNQLNAQQCKLFIVLEIRSQSFAETFDKMVAYVHEHAGHDEHGHGGHGGHGDHGGHGGHGEHGGHDDHSKGHGHGHDDGDDADLNHEMQEVTVGQSLNHILKQEFYCKRVWKQLLTVFLTCLLVLCQETAAIFFLADIEQPVLDYNNVAETWEETIHHYGHFYVFANEVTATGDSTTDLLAKWNTIVNPADAAHHVPYVVQGGDSHGDDHGEAVILETYSDIWFTSSSPKTTLKNAAEKYQEENVKKHNHAYGAYYIFNMKNDEYAIGVYGNQIAAASCPTFGATMLQAVAQTIIENNESAYQENFQQNAAGSSPTVYPVVKSDTESTSMINLSFNNKMMSYNNRLLPQYKPIIAEVYGTSIIAATLVVIVFNIIIVGKPISSGFYTAFLASGGHRFSYFCSKYMKALCANFIMAAITLALMYGQKLESKGFAFFMILWVFISPVYVTGITCVHTLINGKPYTYAMENAYFIQALVAVLALTMAGTLLFSDGILYMFPFFFFMSLNPSVLLLMISQIGFVWERILVVNNQDKITLDLNPWSHLTYQLMIVYMGVSFLLSLFIIWRSTLRVGGGQIEGCCVKPRIPPILPASEFDDPDVIDEANRVVEHLKQPDPNNCGQILMIENLQTFDYYHRFTMYEQAEPGQKVGQVYFHDDYSRGVYTTKGVSFSVGRNERFVVLDASRAGPADLLNCIAGQKNPMNGNICINGTICEDLVKNYTQLHGNIGFQPRFDSVDDRLTVYQHLVLFAGIAGVPKVDCDKHAKKMIKALLLEDKTNEPAEDLTHGQLRRLTLGMALIGRPKLVVLSCPLEGVDPHTKNKMIDTIIKYTKGRALLMSSQDPVVTSRIADRVAIMDEGKFIAIGTVSHILQTHSSGFTLEVQADKKKLKMQRPQIEEGESRFVESHSEAIELLKKVQSKLEDETIDIGCEDFVKQYSQSGMLKPLWLQVEAPESTVRDNFFKELLVLNMALSIHKIIDEDYPDLQIQINSVEGDLIHFQLTHVPQNFDVAHFTELVDEMTRDLAISYFSIGRATLEDVHNKLISDLHEQMPIEEAVGKAGGDGNLILKSKRTVFAQSPMRQTTSTKKMNFADSGTPKMGQDDDDGPNQMMAQSIN